MIRIFFTLFFIALSILPKDGFSFPKTESDFRALPPFCKARYMPDDAPANRTWKKKLGGDFIHVHHYCSSLHALNVARLEVNAAKRAELLTASLGGINYMEEAASPTFVLFPHIFVTKADIYSELNRNQEALKYLNKAIQLNPKYIHAYTKLFDLYYKLGQKTQALEVVKKGLAIKPNSKTLKKQLSKLQ